MAFFKNSLVFVLVLGVLGLLLPSLASAATLSGTGCSTNGDCVVSSSQTIYSGTTYYFNSLVINPGVTVTLAYSTGDAGGTVKFYVANDANISGAISASALGTFSGVGGSNPDGGGYAGGSTNGDGTGGGGGGVIWIYARNLNLAGSLSARGGSGGTVKLVAGTLKFTGSIDVGGGNGCTNVCNVAGGGAGGSVIIIPMSVVYLSSGSIAANGGAGGTGCSRTAESGAGAGGAGGTGQYASDYGAGGGGSGGVGRLYNSGGSANSARNIKLYNAYIPSGSAFSISSSGKAAGLMDAYLTPSSSKYSGLSVTYKTDKILFGSFGSNMYPTASTNFTIVNASNQGQVFVSVLTGSDGTVTSTASLSSSESYNAITSAASNNGYVALSYAGSSTSPQGSTFLKTSSIIPKLLLRWLTAYAYSPSNTPLSGKGVYVTTGGAYACTGSTDSSGTFSCLLVKTAVDGSNAAVDYLVNITVAEYNSPIMFDYMEVPNTIYLGGANDSLRLTGFTSTTRMSLNSNYYRYIFYPVKSNGENSFAFRETIPADFSFSSPAIVYMSNGTSVYNCSVGLTGHSYLLDSSDCPILGNQASAGDWIQVAYVLNSPTTDAFFTQTKDYDFSAANLSLTSP